MLAACRRLLGRQGSRAILINGGLELLPGLAPVGRGFASETAAAEEEQAIVASNTPVTKRLWQQRYSWTDEKLAAAPPRDLARQHPKPPHPIGVTYQFNTDELLREHYRNPWEQVRLGRILEDLDSLAALVAFEHCDMADDSARPPLLVTASVEAIQLRSSKLNLRQNMRMCGRVVWTGSSSLDVRLELEQGGQQQLAALFTFVARDAITNKAHPIAPLLPRSKQDQDMFCERQRASQRRRVALQAGAGSGTLHHVSPEAEKWAEELLCTAKTKRDLPALADANLLFMDDTSLENTFTCQPQQRNIHGRVFGGFLMRRAYELAHSTTYLFAGCRPHAVEVGQITFRRPVNVGDLIKFKSWVMHTWVSHQNPGQGVAHVQVEASVTQPEKRHSIVTNTFEFLFNFDLQRDAAGVAIPPKRILPATEQQALEVARLFGPGGKWEASMRQFAANGSGRSVT